MKKINRPTFLHLQRLDQSAFSHWQQKKQEHVLFQILLSFDFHHSLHCASWGLDWRRSEFFGTSVIAFLCNKVYEIATVHSAFC